MTWPRRRWTEADDAELRRLAETGLTRIEIAQRLKRSVGATEVRASNLGIKIASAVTTFTRRGQSFWLGLRVNGC